jgi:hypothetical protein
MLGLQVLVTCPKNTVGREPMKAESKAGVRKTYQTPQLTKRDVLSEVAAKPPTIL